MQLVDNNNRPTGDYWTNIIGPDSVVISWGMDSVITTYDQIDDLELRVTEGRYQFHIYPLRQPASSKTLLWYSYFVYEIDQNKELEFIPRTEYFLVLLDTTSTWDFNTGARANGFQYLYYRADTLTNFWPSYTMDYYCGTKGIDSTRYEFKIDSAKAETIYLVKCLNSYTIRIKVDLRYSFTNIESKFDAR
jgi:hypothetical protein